jgi:hypothetical protein
MYIKFSKYINNAIILHKEKYRKPIIKKQAIALSNSLFFVFFKFV